MCFAIWVISFNHSRLIFHFRDWLETGFPGDSIFFWFWIYWFFSNKFLIGARISLLLLRKQLPQGFWQAHPVSAGDESWRGFGSRFQELESVWWRKLGWQLSDNRPGFTPTLLRRASVLFFFYVYVANRDLITQEYDISVIFLSMFSGVYIDAACREDTERQNESLPSRME